MKSGHLAIEEAKQAYGISSAASLRETRLPHTIVLKKIKQYFVLSSSYAFLSFLP